VAAAFSILPHLLAAQIITQNTLLAQYYTTLHNYCQDEGFPSPPPPMEEVIAQWDADFKPIRKEVESINCIARGKVVHTSMKLGDDPNNRKSSSVTGLNIRNNISSSIPSRRGSSQGMIAGQDSTAARPETRVMRIPSSSSIPSTASRSDYHDSEPEDEPQRDTHLSPAYSLPAISHSPGGPTRDYFARDRQPSDRNISGVLSPGSFAVVGKKKPPPPPPKRIQSATSDIFVKAMYTFAGQEAGDLSFNEGDRIKVIKKTDSTDDWWDGELRGHRGRFPANYCEMAR
jgi:amphiphysin